MFVAPCDRGVSLPTMQSRFRTNAISQTFEPMCRIIISCLFSLVLSKFRISLHNAVNMQRVSDVCVERLLRHLSLGTDVFTPAELCELELEAKSQKAHRVRSCKAQSPNY